MNLETYLTNWRTTAAGLTLIGLAILEIAGVKIAGLPSDPGALIVQGLAGLGLIVAKDAHAP